MNNQLDLYRITIGLENNSGNGSFIVKFDDDKKISVSNDYVFLVYVNDVALLPKVNDEFKENNTFKIIISYDGEFMGNKIEVPIDTCKGKCVVKKCERCFVPVSKESFYRLTVGLTGTNKENYLLKLKFPESKIRKEEILDSSRTIFVMCNSSYQPPNPGDKIHEKLQFIQILDPDTLADLGKTLECSTTSENRNPSVAGGETVECIVEHCEESNPPEWIPIPNDNTVSISSEKLISIFISDNKLGEISYKAKSIDIKGKDIRVYGNKIEYDDKVIKVTPFETGENVLSIKGSQLIVQDVRTSDISRIQIVADGSLRVLLKSQSEACVIKTEKKNYRKNKWWLLPFFFLIIMTFLPFFTFNIVNKQYSSIQTEIQNNDTPKTTVYTHNYTKPNKPAWVFGVTFYFVAICLLYLALYVILIFITIQVFHSSSRHNKLHGDLSGVLEALKNEKSKDKRLAMQKKILDDMINTYLDKRTIED